VLDLYEELKALVARLTERDLDFALCGGLAMAVHSLPRATIDIDLLVPSDALEAVRSVLRNLGYRIETLPMRLAGGAVQIRHLSKADPDSGDLLTVDLLLVTPPSRSRGRRGYRSSGSTVVSRWCPAPA
jgi:hypothetical protein